MEYMLFHLQIGFTQIKSSISYIPWVCLCLSHTYTHTHSNIIWALKAKEPKWLAEEYLITIFVFIRSINMKNFVLMGSYNNGGKYRFVSYSMVYLRYPVMSLNK